MTPTDYFKLQAKNLFRDYKTKTSYVDGVDGNSYYKYDPKYFDIDQIFLDFDWDEENFSLMNAQHLIACIVGFRKWTDLSKASEAGLELAKLLFDNQDKMHLENWKMHVAMIENDYNATIDDESRLEMFKQIVANHDGHESSFPDYRLNKRTG